MLLDSTVRRRYLYTKIIKTILLRLIIKAAFLSLATQSILKFVSDIARIKLIAERPLTKSMEEDESGAF